MNKLRSVSMLAAAGIATLGIGSTAFAQYQPAPQAPGAESSPQTSQSPDADAASSPHQRDVTSRPGTPETSTTESPDPDAASSPHQRGAVGDTPAMGQDRAIDAPKIVGLEVVSTTGQPLGAVIDTVLAPTGEPDYVVISTGEDTATAVPYSAANSMVTNNKLVVDRSKLQSSPQVVQSDLRDKANTKWRKAADTYWGTGTIRSASPGDVRKPKDR
ncbi:MAG TPA: PRC-barrel domain-containing protein [Steroidobacteraceae bacterium]|nr:PRC-barrel domain-containing protein [Steroidobacteraceae bacterium]